jgi:hypothetical protein
MHKQRIALLVIAGVGILGTFLTWISMVVRVDVPTSSSEIDKLVREKLQETRSDLERDGWSCSSSSTGGFQARQLFSGTRGDGWISLGLYVPAVLLALVPGRRGWTRSWRGGWFFAYAVPALLASLVGIYHLVNVQGQQAALSAQLHADPRIALLEVFKVGIDVQQIGVGPGLYLVTAAGIVLVIGAFLLRGPAQPAAVRSDAAIPVVI